MGRPRAEHARRRSTELEEGRSARRVRYATSGAERCRTKSSPRGRRRCAVQCEGDPRAATGEAVTRDAIPQHVAAPRRAWSPQARVIAYVRDTQLERGGADARPGESSASAWRGDLPRARERQAELAEPPARGAAGDARGRDGCAGGRAATSGASAGASGVGASAADLCVATSATSWAHR